jgi:hypothetical protein
LKNQDSPLIEINSVRDYIHILMRGIEVLF